MPRYDYCCSKCGKTVEVILPISSDPRKRLRCTTCRGATMKRQIGTGGGVTVADRSRERMYSRYPVVSNRLPFGLPNCPHAGPLNKSVITSRAHEKQVYASIDAKRGD